MSLASSLVLPNPEEGLELGFTIHSWDLCDTTHQTVSTLWGLAVQAYVAAMFFGKFFMPHGHNRMLMRMTLLAFGVGLESYDLTRYSGV